MTDETTNLRGRQTKSPDADWEMIGFAAQRLGGHDEAMGFRDVWQHSALRLAEPSRR